MRGRLFNSMGCAGKPFEDWPDYPVGANHGFEQVFHGFNSTFTDFVFIMRLPQSFLRWYFQFEGFCGKTFRKDETGGANFSQRRIEGHKVAGTDVQFNGLCRKTFRRLARFILWGPTMDLNRFFMVSIALLLILCLL